MGKKKKLVESEDNTKKYFFVWLLSIFVFFFSTLGANGDFSNSPKLFLILFFASVLVGFGFFILLFLNIIKLKNWRLLLTTAGITLLFFVILFNLSSTTNKKTDGLSYSDPLVDCPVNERCGNGTKRMKQSECINSTCCQIGDVWVSIDKDECKLKQQEYQQSNRSAPAQETHIQLQPVELPQVPQAPICCKESCNSFSGTCTTRCNRSWFCF